MTPHIKCSKICTILLFLLLAAIIAVFFRFEDFDSQEVKASVVGSDIELKAGWNLISLPIGIEGVKLTTPGADVTELWAYREDSVCVTSVGKQDCLYVFPSKDGYNLLLDLREGEVYWINVTGDNGVASCDLEEDGCMSVSSASGDVSLSKGTNTVNPDIAQAILDLESSVDFYIAGWDNTNAKWIATDNNSDAVDGYDQLTDIEPDKGYLIYFDDDVDDAALASLSTALAESMTLVLSESRMSETAADTCEDCSGVDNPCTMQECWGINSNCVSIWFMAEACFTGSGSSLDEGDVCDSERQCGNKCPSREYYYLTNSDKWYCGACGEILDGEESISGCLRAGFVPSECECESCAAYRDVAGEQYICGAWTGADDQICDNDNSSASYAVDCEDCSSGDSYRNPAGQYICGAWTGADDQICDNDGDGYRDCESCTNGSFALSGGSVGFYTIDKYICGAWTGADDQKCGYHSSDIADADGCENCQAGSDSYYYKYLGPFVYAAYCGSEASWTGADGDRCDYDYHPCSECDSGDSYLNAEVEDICGGNPDLPTITSVSSDKADGTYGEGEVIDIDVTFSEAVTSTGVTVTLETGTTDRTCTFTVTDSLTGTCNYTVTAGDTSSDLTTKSIAGTITDQSDDAMVDFTPATNLAANKALVISTSDSISNGDTCTGLTECLDECTGSLYYGYYSFATSADTYYCGTLDTNDLTECTTTNCSGECNYGYFWSSGDPDTNYCDEDGGSTGEDGECDPFADEGNECWDCSEGDYYYYYDYSDESTTYYCGDDFDQTTDCTGGCSGVCLYGVYKLINTGHYYCDGVIVDDPGDTGWENGTVCASSSECSSNCENSYHCEGCSSVSPQPASYNPQYYCGPSNPTGTTDTTDTVMCPYGASDCVDDAYDAVCADNEPILACYDDGEHYWVQSNNIWVQEVEGGDWACSSLAGCAYGYWAENWDGAGCSTAGLTYDTCDATAPDYTGGTIVDDAECGTSTTDCANDCISGYYYYEYNGTYYSGGITSVSAGTQYYCGDAPGDPDAIVACLAGDTECQKDAYDTVCEQSASDAVYFCDNSYYWVQSHLISIGGACLPLALCFYDNYVQSDNGQCSLPGGTEYTDCSGSPATYVSPDPVTCDVGDYNCACETEDEVISCDGGYYWVTFNSAGTLCNSDQQHQTTAIAGCDYVSPDSDPDPDPSENTLPTGSLSSATCDNGAITVTGSASDPDDTSEPIAIHIYEGSSILGNCQTGTGTTFDCSFSGVSDGTYGISVYAIDAQTSEGSLLTGSPQSVTCETDLDCGGFGCP